MGAYIVNTDDEYIIKRRTLGKRRTYIIPYNI